MGLVDEEGVSVNSTRGFLVSLIWCTFHVVCSALPMLADCIHKEMHKVGFTVRKGISSDVSAIHRTLSMLARGCQD